jgi:hypothetical protein
MMNEIECPICMDQIDAEKNRVTTECGHCFHASCLMTNVAHNGFGCPYCRTAMTAEVASENSDEEYDDFSFDSQEEEGPDYNDHVLRGARWMFQRAEGEEVDDSDDSESESDDEEAERVEVQPRPTVDYIVEKLVQRGVSMEDLVKSILLRDHDEYQFHDEFERGDNELFGKLRIIISNFRPQPAVQVAAVVEAQPVLEEGEVQEGEGEEVVDTVLSVHEAMILLHKGPIRKGVTVDRNDPNFERFNQYCEDYYSSERVSRYKRIAALVQEEKEEESIKIPFSFQMKGSCVPNEIYSL